MSMSIKYMRLDEILGADENPKDHDIGTIIESIKRTGFNSQLIMNSSTKEISCRTRKTRSINKNV